MQTQIEYILNLAKQYTLYSENSDELVAAVNNLSKEELQEILAEYNHSEIVFQPVNLLRSEIARQLLNGVTITANSVEEIKEKIRRKDLDYFKNLSPDFLKYVEKYYVGDAESNWQRKRDMFSSWSKNWSVFYTFFYRGEIKKTVKLYLEQISKQLLTDLDLLDYKAKFFDFQGARNIGEKSCWIGLVPAKMSSHRDAYQFFLGFRDKFLAGLGVGFNLKDQSKDTEKPAGNYEQALEILQSYRDEIISLNEQILQSRNDEKIKLQNRKYFKFAPGEQASQWERFKTEEIAALSYKNLPLTDISEIPSLSELNLAADFSADSQSNETWNLWLFKTANVGDVIFANKGVNICLGIGIIESEYYYEENAVDYQHRRKIRWITDKVYRYESYNYTDYKTLFRPDTFSPTKPFQFILSEYIRLYPELKAVFDAENLNYDAPQTIEAEVELNEIVYEAEADEAEPYDFLTDADKPFISAEDFFQVVNLLKRKKNIILQGSPGVGKTFIARKLAYQIIGQKADSQIEMVQFHQSFAYEDFVQGLRLVKDGTQIRNGVFYNFCKFAANHPEQDFFFIIDEINRGNLSKIFGELMMLIEHDKREENYALKLTYAEDEHDKFFVPPNVYLIGTMNTADRSLAIVDYALRRRFAFFTLKPQFDADFRDFLQTKGVSESLIGHICRSVSEVNLAISADVNLGAGFQIGHSYFCDGKIGADENLWFQEILNFEIRPLLEEIWFDDQKQIDEMIAKLTF